MPRQWEKTNKNFSPSFGRNLFFSYSLFFKQYLYTSWETTNYLSNDVYTSWETTNYPSNDVYTSWETNNYLSNDVYTSWETNNYLYNDRSYILKFNLYPVFTKFSKIIRKLPVFLGQNSMKYINFT